MIGLTSVCELSDDVRYRIIQDQAVVLHLENGELMVLNEVGGRILELTDGEKPVRRIVDELAEIYDVERSELEADVLEFLEELSDSGFAAEVEA